MPVSLESATSLDAPAIAALRNATAADLDVRHGSGWWSGRCTERGVLFDLRQSSVFLVRERTGGAPIATFRLATKKPWAIDRTCFTAVPRPLYLTSMAVEPSRQRTGVGRACLEHARELARRWPAQSLCLDAFDHAAGAGEFYRKCGFRECGRATYRTVPLIYFELLV
jgi:GNAT superfamily N-acetyltransferase